MFGGFNNSSAHWRSLLSPNIQHKNITVKTRGGKQRVTYDMLRLTICYLNSYRYGDSAIIDTLQKKKNI